MSNVNILPGGRINQADALVSADQETIIGDGTAANPLRGGTASGVTVEAAVAGADAVKGYAMMVSTGGDTIRAENLAGGHPCIGLLTASAAVGEQGVVKNSGTVVMTADEWDAVIEGGSPAGLQGGKTYYASAVTDGKIGIFAFSPADIALQIGTALNSTTLVLQLMAPYTVS